MGKEKLACFDGAHSYESNNRSPDLMYYEWLGAQDICEKAMLLIKDIPGISGMLTREMWERVSLAERVKRAHDAGADVFLSKHSNASGSGGWQSPNGYGVYPYPNKNIDLAEIGLQECDRIIGLLMNSRGIRPANFYVTRETRMPALLFETGFHTHQGDVALLKTHEFRYLAAEVLVRTACMYVKVPFVKKQPMSDLAPSHTVVSGDSISRIANHYGLSRDELISFNPHIPNPNLILAEFGGDILYLAEATDLQLEYGQLRREYILCKKMGPLYENQIEILENKIRNLEQTLASTLTFQKTVGNRIITEASKLL